MNKSIRLKNFAVASIICLFTTGCSTDHTDSDNSLPDGAYPMAFTINVENPTATRAGTVDGQWNTGDPIAVQVLNEDQKVSNEEDVRQYTPVSDGNSWILQAASGVVPFFWQARDEKKLVRAWYCGDGSTAAGGSNAVSLPEIWEVQSDQRGDGYQKSDFLYAPVTEISFGESADLTFYHQTARIVINIRKAQATMGVNADEINVVFGDENEFYLSKRFYDPVKFPHLTTSWSNGDKKGTIIPRRISSNNSDIICSYEAIILPQAAKGKFIKITIGTGPSARNYFYAPNASTHSMSSNEQYTFTVTVMKNELIVEEEGAVLWEEETIDGNID